MEILKWKFKAVQAVFGDEQNCLPLSCLITEHTFFRFGVSLLRGTLSPWQLMTCNHTALHQSYSQLTKNLAWHMHIFSKDGGADKIIRSALQKKTHNRQHSAYAYIKRKKNEKTDNPSRQTVVYALLRHQAPLPSMGFCPLDFQSLELKLGPHPNVQDTLGGEGSG